MLGEELTAWARCVLNDFDARTPWRSFTPPREMTSEQAYALQGEVARLRENRGEGVLGYKIGCTSPAIQEQFGIREPIFGRIFDTGCFLAGATLDHAGYANLGVEGELAIRLARDLPGRALSDDEYVGAIESIFPVIELHQYALPASCHPLAALIVSGGMHAGLILPVQEAMCSGGIPVVQEVEVTINGRLVGATSEPWTMGGPAASLRWLTSRLAQMDLQVRRGQVILTGSPLPLYPVDPGSRVTSLARPIGQTTVAIV
jgi:2-keto-4-pentenoate hydratase